MSERAEPTGGSGAERLPPWKTTRIRWLEGGFLLAYHVGALFVFVVGFSWPALVAFLVVYWTQIFGLSAGYHRYFSHRSFKTGRTFQLLLAVLGGLAAQMGPLWWASHHRRHHRYPDRDGDVHSPVLYGFLWSHVVWILAEETKHADWGYVKDWARRSSPRAACSGRSGPDGGPRVCRCWSGGDSSARPSATRSPSASTP